MSQYRMVPWYFTYPIVVTGCFLGGIFSLAVGLELSNSVGIIVGVALSVASVLSSVTCPLRFKMGTVVATDDPIVGYREAVIVHLLLFTSLITLFYSTGHRSISVLGLLGLLYFSSFVTIFYSKVELGLILFILSAIYHRITIFFANPIVYGNDSLFHGNLIRRTIELGGVVPSTEAGKYTVTPLYHLFMAIFAHTTSVPVRLVSFFGLTLLYIVLPAAILYWIGLRVGNKQVGVFVVILYSVSDHAIGWSVEPHTTSFGLILFSVGIFVLVRWINTANTRYQGIFLFIAAVITLMHQVSVFIFLVAATSLVLIAKVRIKELLTSTYLYTLIVSYLISGVVWTIVEFQSFGGSMSFLQRIALNIHRRIRFGNADRVFIAPPSDMNAVTPGTSNLPLVHVAGFGLLLMLGMLGALAMVRHRYKPQVAFLLLPTIGIMCGISFGSALVATLLQPTRWIQFIYIFLAILGSVGLVSLLGNIHKKYHRISYITFFMIYLTLMSGSVVAGPDGIVHADTAHVQDYQLSEQEHALLQSAHRWTNDDVIVGGDFLAKIVVSRHYESEAFTYGWSTEALQTVSGPQLLIERPHLYSGHASYRYATESGTQKVTGYPPTRLDDCVSNIVYDAGNSGEMPHYLRYRESGCGSLFG